MHASALVFRALEYAGVPYLFHLAVSCWRDRAPMVPEAVQNKDGARGVVLKAVLPDIRNPNLTLFTGLSAAVRRVPSPPSRPGCWVPAA